MLVTGEGESKELGSFTVEFVQGGALIRDWLSRERENDDNVKSARISLLFNPLRSVSTP